MIYKIIAFVVILCAVVIFVYQSTDKFLNLPKISQAVSKSINLKKENIHEAINSTAAISDLEKNMSKISFSNQDPAPTQTSLRLNSKNFEESIQDCMNEKTCDAPEDPWMLYLHFKRLKNRKANYSLISYLSRKKLIDPKLRNQYKEVVKLMIDDFYPQEDKPDAEAEYYMLIKENEKALKIYLDLEKKTKNDPRKHSTFDLNIANLYFDLNHFREALPYYQAVYDVYLVDEQNDPNQVGVLDYVRSRINEINKHLSEGSH